MTARQPPGTRRAGRHASLTAATRTAVRAVPCPSCGAEPGVCCVTERARALRASSHPARIRAFLEPARAAALRALHEAHEERGETPCS